MAARDFLQTLIILHTGELLENWQYKTTKLLTALDNKDKKHLNFRLGRETQSHKESCI